MTAILSSINLIAKNIDSDLYDNGEAFCRFHHSTIVGSRVLLGIPTVFMLALIYGYMSQGSFCPYT